MHRESLDYELVEVLLKDRVLSFFCHKCQRIFADSNCTVPLIDLKKIKNGHQGILTTNYPMAEVPCKNCQSN